MSQEEKAAARAAERERRQARIRAGASNRLAKITGSAGTQDFKPPVREVSSPKPIAPVDEEADPEVPSGDQLLKFLNQSSESPQDDPLLAYLSQATGPQSPQQMPASQSQSHADMQRHYKQRSSIDFFWNVLHLTTSVLIGLYAALVNPFNLSLVFVTLQVVLVSIKSVLGHNSGLSSVPMIAPFLAMLPKTRQRQLSFAGNFFHAMRDSYRDFAIIIFIYSLFSLGVKDHERPI